MDAGDFLSASTRLRGQSGSGCRGLKQCAVFLGKFCAHAAICGSRLRTCWDAAGQLAQFFDVSRAFSAENQTALFARWRAVISAAIAKQYNQLRGERFAEATPIFRTGAGGTASIRFRAAGGLMTLQMDRLRWCPKEGAASWGLTIIR